MSEHEYVQVDQVLKITDKAVLLKVDSLEIWCPKSLIDEESRYDCDFSDIDIDFGNTSCELMIEKWWIEENL